MVSYVHICEFQENIVEPRALSLLRPNETSSHFYVGNGLLV